MKLYDQMPSLRTNAKVGQHRFLNMLAAAIQEKMREHGIELTIGGKTTNGPITVTLSGEKVFETFKDKEKAIKEIEEYMDDLQNPSHLIEELKRADI